MTLPRLRLGRRDTAAPPPVEPARRPLRMSYVVGLDLGQSVDPTAIAVIRRLDYGDDKPLFECGHLERLPLHIPYPSIIRHVKSLMARLPPAELVVDKTGVGAPVVDLLWSAGLNPIAVSITAGDTVTNEGTNWHVPKLILVSRLQALLHDGRLKIQASLPDASALKRELADFRARVSDTGQWRFGAREGAHDDLVLSLGIALWRSYASESSAAFVGFYEKLAANGGKTEAPADPPVSIAHSFAVIRRPAPSATVATLHAPPGWAHYIGKVQYREVNGVVTPGVELRHVSALLDHGAWCARGDDGADEP